MRVYNRTYGELHVLELEDFRLSLPKRWQKKYPKKLYYKVINTYLTLWVTQFYSNPFVQHYFPLGGMVRMCTQLWKGKQMIKWVFLRQFESNYKYCVVAKVMRGGSPTKMQEDYLRETKDVDQLRSHDGFIKEILREEKQTL